MARLGSIGMAKKKTSAELAREQNELAKVEGMLGDAFGNLEGLETPVTKGDAKPEEVPEEDEIVEGSEPEAPTHIEEDIPVEELSQSDEKLEDEKEKSDDGSEEEGLQQPAAPSGPPSKGPPSGPPSKGPPSGPPSKGPPSKPPSGPPSKDLPSLPPQNPPKAKSLEVETQADDAKESPSEEVVAEDAEASSESAESEEDPLPTVEEGSTEEETSEEELDDIDEISEGNEENDITSKEDIEVENTEPENTVLTDELLIPENATEEEIENLLEKEAEIARLSAEVEQLRSSMAGAAEVIEELENPPMPPIVTEDLVIGAHIVADMARMARQLDREELVRASMGTIATLHPQKLEVLISTKHKAMLPRMNEKDICAGKLGGEAPRGAPEDWRVLEVLLASASLITGGPAAVIHAHGPYTTAVSCEKDLVLMQPIDEIGKEHIGKIIIVDPDPENPDEFLRQVAEALQQGGMRCVVVRGNGAYAVGADLDQAWANAAMLEHSMKIVLLARQANLKI